MKKLKAKAKKVQLQHDNMRLAYVTENQAKGKFLAQLIETVKPALPALASRLSLDGYLILPHEAGIFLPSKGATGAMSLLKDGRLAQSFFHPSTSQIQSQIISPQEAAPSLDILPVVKRLNELLDKQLNGNASKKTDEALRIASKLRAVTTLLEDL